MTKRRKVLLWIGVVISIPATGYAGISVIFYFCLNAANPDKWPAAKAGLWAGSALFLTVIFFGLFVYCVRALVKEANREYRVEKL